MRAVEIEAATVPIHTAPQLHSQSSPFELPELPPMAVTTVQLSMPYHTAGM